MRLKLFAALLLALVVISFVSAQELVPLPTKDSPAHYLVVEADASGAVKIVHHQRVNLKKSFTTLSDTEMTSALAASNRLKDTVGVQLLDAQGNLAYQTVIRTSHWIRGEFQIDENDPNVMQNGTNIDSHVLEQSTKTFVIRIPDIGMGSTLRVQSGAATRATTDINLDTVAQEFAGRAVTPRSSTPIEGWSNGDSTNRVDILVMGDGYTSADETTFNTDAKNLADGFGAITPYKEYANYVNMAQLYTVSAQSGADRPVCPTDPAPGGEDDGTMVNTAFDATFCYAGIWRLLVVNDSKIYTAAAAAPDWDHILVVVNTSIYGGSGGDFATLSTHPYAIDIMQHELGHSFTELADEYSDAYPGYPACSDTDGVTYNDCEANVTNATTIDQIRWKYWIDPSTSIPTGGQLPDQEAAGLWQGARYLTTGMYRQGYNCMMRSLARPFCYVASEAYVLRLYSGGWGNPVAGIRMVEPGTLSPAPGSVHVQSGTSQNFSGQILAPEIGPNASIIWILNGTTVENDSAAAGDTASYTFAPAVDGDYTLEMRVIDNSPIIHPTLRESLATVYSWTINVSDNTPTPTPRPGFELVQNGGFEATTDTRASVLSPWQVKNATGDKIKCNKYSETGNKIVSKTGECAFQFKGGAGENSKLVQSLDPFATSFTVGDTLDLFLFAKAGNTAVGKVKVIIKYSDATEKDKIAADIIGTGDYAEVTGDKTLASGNVSAIKLQISNKSTSGKIYVDDVSLTQLTVASGRLALPQ